MISKYKKLPLLSLDQKKLKKNSEEKVTPKSKYKILKISNQNFPKYIHKDLKFSADELKQCKTLIFKKARVIGEFLLNNILSNHKANKLQHEITGIIKYVQHSNKVSQKSTFLIWNM